MEWFNIFGFIIICIIMIPNVIFAIKCKEEFENKWNSIFHDFGKNLYYMFH